MKNSEIKVSVHCATYNHAPYIRDALESFVSQKADFCFEIIVHDDASTDGTSEVVREYAVRYPDLIKPIIQKENQYRKGVYPKTYLYPATRGKYVALCEGDDYWISPDKLQKQVDFLESNPSYVACAHGSYVIDAVTKKRKRSPFLHLRDMDVSFETSTLSMYPPYHTSSLMYRKEVVLDNQPSFLMACPGIGDYPVRILLMLYGRIKILKEVMSVYRTNVSGSWTMRQNRSSEIKINNCKNLINMLEQADAYSEYKYHDRFMEGVAEQRYRMLDYSKDYLGMLDKQFKKVRRRDTWKHRVKTRIVGVAQYFKATPN